ncbi:RAB7A-interacting MON1-CCZ1 complex subunit 1-like [Littorina saxatilis]|uniref:Uncharacterized protein n=1 Tax=Littorina saxatilis TaxID=31220 RepID=A0AAN9GAV7_9CAEN
MAEQVKSSTTPSDIKTDSQPLSSYLQRISEDIDKNIHDATEETSQFLQHCKKKCSSLQQSSQAQDLTPASLKSVLQDTAHMVLDYTYLDETLLAEAEFPAENATDRINAIFDQLDLTCKVANECFQNKPVLETLGEELVECIHWRKGALLYMYCHTLESNNRPCDPSKYKQCLEEGVGHLGNMLSTRQPTAVPNSLSADDTLQLFSQGVYSDTHLLAMMYAGEMCYWYQQAVDKKLFSPDTPGSPGTGDSDAFNAKTQGLRYLDRYLSAVKGPLKGQDWNTSRAEEIVKFLQSH